MNSTAPNQECDVVDSIGTAGASICFRAYEGDPPNAETLAISGIDLARHFIQQAMMAAAALPGGEADPQTAENGLACGAGLTVEEASDIIRESLMSAVDAMDGAP